MPPQKNREDLAKENFPDHLKELEKYLGKTTEINTTMLQGFLVNGKDRRVEVDTKANLKKHLEHPYSAILNVTARFESSQFTQSGTAFMVSPRVALTCAHNAYLNNDINNQADAILCTPGRYLDDLPFGVAKVTHVILLNKSLKNQANDLALFVLDRDIGLYTGWFGMKVLSLSDIGRSLNQLKDLENSIIDDGFLEVTGYSNPEKIAPHLLTHREKVRKNKDNKAESSINEFTLFYEIDTFQGQSGSPVWIREGQDFYAVGVHNSYSSTFNCNGGARLDTQRFLAIKKIIDNNEKIGTYSEVIILREKNAKLLEKLQALKKNMPTEVATRVTALEKKIEKIKGTSFVMNIHEINLETMEADMKAKEIEMNDKFDKIMKYVKEELELLKNIEKSIESMKKP